MVLIIRVDNNMNGMLGKHLRYIHARAGGLSVCTILIRFYSYTFTRFIAFVAGPDFHAIVCQLNNGIVIYRGYYYVGGLRS